MALIEEKKRILDLKIVKKKILVVEDEFVIAYDLKQILEGENHEVFFNVSSVEAAIDILKSITIDLVLLDISLKGTKTGLDLAAFINLHYKIPFIYITSYYDIKTLKDISTTKPSAYLVKPFKPMDVITAVQLAFIDDVEKGILDEADHEQQIPYRIKKVLLYIDNHLQDRIEIETLASLTDWNKQHFIRTFQKVTQTTPYQYILQRKIEKACEMILSTEDSCASIAFEFGFLSYANFHNAFKRLKNCTPEQYRLKYK